MVPLPRRCRYALLPPLDIGRLIAPDVLAGKAGHRGTESVTPGKVGKKMSQTSKRGLSHLNIVSTRPANRPPMSIQFGVSVRSVVFVTPSRIKFDPVSGTKGASVGQLRNVLGRASAEIHVGKQHALGYRAQHGIIVRAKEIL